MAFGRFELLSVLSASVGCERFMTPSTPCGEAESFLGRAQENIYQRKKETNNMFYVNILIISNCFDMSVLSVLLSYFIEFF